MPIKRCIFSLSGITVVQQCPLAWSNIWKKHTVYQPLYPFLSFRFCHLTILHFRCFVCVEVSSPHETQSGRSVAQRRTGLRDQINATVFIPGLLVPNTANCANGQFGKLQVSPVICGKGRPAALLQCAVNMKDKLIFFFFPHLPSSVKSP